MNTTQGSPHGTYRKLAISAGVLFILYDLVDFSSFPFLGPVNAPNYLVSASANSSLVGMGALLLIIGGCCASGIALSLYPVLKKFNAGLALGAVGFRISEGVLRIVATCAYLLLITLSRQFVQAGAPDPSYFQTLGILITSGNTWVNSGSLLTFSIGALLYSIVLYRSNLIPRWLSLWGIVATLLSMTSVVFVTVGLIAPKGTVQLLMNLGAILPQEIVLAVWLIAKGFNPSVIASLPAKTATNELLSAS